MAFLEAVDIRPGEADDQGCVWQQCPEVFYRVGAAPGVNGQHCVARPSVVFGKCLRIVSEFPQDRCPAICGSTVARPVTSLCGRDNGYFHEEPSERV